MDSESLRTEADVSGWLRRFDATWWKLSGAVFAVLWAVQFVSGFRHDVALGVKVEPVWFTFAITVTAIWAAGATAMCFALPLRILANLAFVERRRNRWAETVRLSCLFVGLWIGYLVLRAMVLEIEAARGY